MKKWILLLLAALLLSGEAQAGPIRWVKNHKRASKVLATIAATSVYQYVATRHCERGNVERCQEGYGERKSFDFVSMGFDFAMFGAAEGCWKQTGDWKGCYALAYIGPAFQVYYGTSDFIRYQPKTKTDASGIKVDLSHVEFSHR